MSVAYVLIGYGVFFPATLVGDDSMMVPISVTSNEPGVFVDASIVINDGSPQEIKASAETGWPKRIALKLTVPTSPKRLVVRGSVVVRGKTEKFEQTWNLVDGAEKTKGLWKKETPLNERLRVYFETMHGDEFLGCSIKKRAGMSDEQVSRHLQEIEAKVGRPIPQELRNIAGYEIDISDSHFQTILQFETVAETMKSEWELDVERVFSATIAEKFRRSVVVFREVGDGLAVLGWDPAAEEEADDTWFWIGQGDSEPEIMKTNAGKPVPADVALLSALERSFIFLHYFEEIAGEGIIGPGEMADDDAPWLIIDSSHPALVLFLSVYANDDGRLEVELNPRHFRTSW